MKDRPKVPKYEIGDTVYRLDDKKVVTNTVIGVVAIFDRDLSRYDAKKPAKFVEFRYTFDVKNEVPRYGWISEEQVFPSKDELLASL